VVFLFVEQRFVIKVRKFGIPSLPIPESEQVVSLPGQILVRSAGALHKVDSSISKKPHGININFFFAKCNNKEQ
jgi:hypothetical protein